MKISGIIMLSCVCILLAAPAGLCKTAGGDLVPAVNMQARDDNFHFELGIGEEFPFMGDYRAFLSDMNSFYKGLGVGGSISQPLITSFDLNLVFNGDPEKTKNCFVVSLGILINDYEQKTDFTDIRNAFRVNIKSDSVYLNFGVRYYIAKSISFYPYWQVDAGPVLDFGHTEVESYYTSGDEYKKSVSDINGLRVNLRIEVGSDILTISGMPAITLKLGYQGIYGMPRTINGVALDDSGFYLKLLFYWGGMRQ